jgi:hypothetical protein
MRPLSAIDTDHSDQSSYSYQYRTSFDQLPVTTTTTARQQHSYVPSDRRPARGSTSRRTCKSLAGRYKSPRCLITSAATSPPASDARSQSAAARSNTQAHPTTRPPQRTGNSTRISSADYPLAVRAAREIHRTQYGHFRGHQPPAPAAPVSGPRIHRTQYGPFRGHQPPAPAVPLSCLVLRSGGAVIDARLPWRHSHKLLKCEYLTEDSKFHVHL